MSGYLKKLGPSCPKLVRVYSENIEHKEFPLPRDPIPTRRQSSAASASTDPTLRDIALHHLIRQPSCDYSLMLRMYDEHFARCPEEVSDEEVEEYQRLVTEAEVAEIKSAEILLCTSSVSSSPRMSYGSSVNQVDWHCKLFTSMWWGVSLSRREAYTLIWSFCLWFIRI